MSLIPLVTTPEEAARFFRAMSNVCLNTEAITLYGTIPVRDALLSLIPFVDTPEVAVDVFLLIANISTAAAAVALYRTASVRDALMSLVPLVTTPEAAILFLRALRNICCIKESIVLYGTPAVCDALMSLVPLVTTSDAATEFLLLIARISIAMRPVVLYGTPPYRDALMALVPLVTSQKVAASVCSVIAGNSKAVDPTTAPSTLRLLKTEVSPKTRARNSSSPTCMVDAPRTTLDRLVSADMQLTLPQIASVLSHRLVDTLLDELIVEGLVNAVPYERATRMLHPFLCEPMPITAVQFQFRPPFDDFKETLDAAVIAIVQNDALGRNCFGQSGFNLVHESGAFGIYCNQNQNHVTIGCVAGSKSLALLHVDVRSTNGQHVRSMHFCVCKFSGWSADHNNHRLRRDRGLCSCEDCRVMRQIPLHRDSHILIIGNFGDMTEPDDLQFIRSTGRSAAVRACHGRSISVAAVVDQEFSYDLLRAVVVTKYTIA